MTLRHAFLAGLAVLLIFIGYRFWREPPEAQRAPSSSTEPASTKAVIAPIEKAIEETIEEPVAAEPRVGSVASEDTIATALEDSCLELNPALNPPLSKEESKRLETDMTTRMTAARKQLRASTMREHLHARAMMTNDSAERLKMLSQVLHDDPNNLLALWHAVHACAKLSRDFGCPFQEWEQRLIQLDGQNSRLWLLVASNQYNAGETTDALESMKRAATSAESRHYIKESMNMYQEAYASTGLFSSTEEVMLGVTFGMDWHPAYRQYETMCFEQSEVDVEWAQACGDYGARNTTTHGPVASSKSANAIHVNALRNLGESEKAHAVQKAFSELIKPLDDFSSNYSDDRRAVLLANPEMLERAMSYIRDEGELAGYHYLFAELDKVYTRSNRPECNPEQAPDGPGAPTP